MKFFVGERLRSLLEVFFQQRVVCFADGLQQRLPVTGVGRRDSQRLPDSEPGRGCVR